MAVYVDNGRYSFGRMIMCHMGADSLEELHTMADKIGVARKWFQDDPRHPHYDICLSKRTSAVQYGAVEVTQRELAMIFRKQRQEE